MSKHSPVQTVVHPRRIVYLNKGYMFWAGETSGYVEGDAYMWEYISIHQEFKVCIHVITIELYCTYAVKYTYVCRPGQMQCGRARAMSDTCGDTNTKHGLQE